MLGGNYFNQFGTKRVCFNGSIQDECAWQSAQGGSWSGHKADVCPCCHRCHVCGAYDTQSAPINIAGQNH